MRKGWKEARTRWKGTERREKRRRKRRKEKRMITNNDTTGQGELNKRQEKAD